MIPFGIVPPTGKTRPAGGVGEVGVATWQSVVTTDTEQDRIDKHSRFSNCFFAGRAVR
jgi:hypothetical protein